MMCVGPCFQRTHPNRPPIPEVSLCLGSFRLQVRSHTTTGMPPVWATSLTAPMSRKQWVSACRQIGSLVSGWDSEAAIGLTLRTGEDDDEIEEDGYDSDAN